MPKSAEELRMGGGKGDVCGVVITHLCSGVGCESRGCFTWLTPGLPEGVSDMPERRASCLDHLQRTSDFIEAGREAP